MTAGDWAAWVAVVLTVIGGILTWGAIVERRLRAMERMQAQVLAQLERLPTMEKLLSSHVADRTLHPNGQLALAYQAVVTQRIDGLEATVNARIEGVAGHVRGVDGRVEVLTGEVHGLSGKIMDVLGMLGLRRGEANG